MTKLIIDAVLCLIGVIVAFYAYKRDIKAMERLRHVEEREKRLKGLHEPPSFGYLYMVDLENHRVIVGGKWIIDGYAQDVCFKEFPYNPDDAEDKAFAIREAEELIDKLKEK